MLLLQWWWWADCRRRRHDKLRIIPVDDQTVRQEMMKMLGWMKDLVRRQDGAVPAVEVPDADLDDQHKRDHQGLVMQMVAVAVEVT